jgi:8-oxo-dGTP diphosphatase
MRYPLHPLICVLQMTANKNQNPHVSVDCVIFGYAEQQLKLLLIRRALHLPQQDGPDRFLALPGDLVLEDEDLNQAAKRVLKELTGLDNVFLEQFAAFGAPERVKKEKDKQWLQSVRQNPDARVITVAYYSLIDAAECRLHPGSFSAQAVWMPISEVPELAFDHNEIFENALDELKHKIQLRPIGFELLPEKFTLGELQSLYEAILGRDLDKRNFRRKMLRSGFVLALEEKQQGVANKPAQFYQFNRQKYEEIGETYVNLRLDGDDDYFLS